MGVQGNSPKKSKSSKNVPDAESFVEEKSYENNVDEGPKEKTDSLDNAEKMLPRTTEESKPNKLSLTNKRKHEGQKLSSLKSTDNMTDIIERTEEYLQKFLVESFGGSSAKVFDVVSTYGELLTYNANAFVIEKGDRGKGVFVILDGKVCVKTSDSVVTLETLQTGDIFGEMSSIYDIPSTAHVAAISAVQLVLIPTAQFRQIAKEFDMTVDIIDWCIRRRYLPTSDLMDSERTYRRTAFTFLTKMNFFLAWPDNALKMLILSIEHNLVLLYPAGSMLILEGDPLNNLVCVIKGSFMICRGPRLIINIEINRNNTPFVFGETGISNDDQTSPVSIRVTETCQVILISKGKVLKVTEEFLDLKEDLLEKNRQHIQFTKNLGHLYNKYEPDVQISVLVYLIMQSEQFSNKPETEIRNKVRMGTYREINTGSKVFTDVENDMFEAFLVIRGEVEMMVTKESEGKMNVLPEGNVGILKDAMLNSVVATSPSLILKIPWSIERPVQEENKLELI